MVAPSNTLHMTPLTTGGPAQHNASQPPTASNAPTNSAAQDKTSEMQQLVQGLTTALTSTLKRNNVNEEALSTTLEITVECLVEEVI